jgi:hypothetical protein
MIKELASIKITKWPDLNAPISKGITEVSSVQNQRVFSWLDQV